MRLIPPRFPLEVHNSGEERVFRELEFNSSHPGLVAYHSLVVTEHAHNILGEIDFLLTSRERVIALEIKGGEVTCGSDGRWHYPYGTSWRSPFKQASEAMFGLRQRLAKEFGEGLVEKIAFGFGVVFTDSNLTSGPTIECPSEALLDARGLGKDPGMNSFLNRMIQYWDNKPGSTRRMGLDDQEFQKMSRFLGNVFTALPNLEAQTRDMDHRINTLTNEQYRLLDIARDFPRMICSGGAGTGKTFLAMELARREVFHGRKVALACWNPVFAAYLRREINDPGVVVMNFASVNQPNVSLPVEHFESLIIDEGQDLLSFGNIDVLDRILEGGFKHGRWALFIDRFNQAGVDGIFDPDALAYLQDFAPPPFKLDRNCRNTQEILTSIKLSTGLDLESSTIGGGPGVKYVKYSDPSEGAVLLAEGIVNLLRGDVKSDDITLLSPSRFADSLASKLPDDLLLKIHEIRRDGSLIPEKGMITFCSIQDFKGLDRRFVFVLDLTASEVENRQNILYVAMSRSRTWLWIGMDPSFKKALGKAQTQNSIVFSPSEHV